MGTVGWSSWQTLIFCKDAQVVTYTTDPGLYSPFRTQPLLESILARRSPPRRPTWISAECKTAAQNHPSPSLSSFQLQWPHIYYGKRHSRAQLGVYYWTRDQCVVLIQARETSTPYIVWPGRLKSNVSCLRRDGSVVDIPEFVTRIWAALNPPTQLN